MWNRLYSNNTPQINALTLPKNALNKAFTDCEKAMNDSTSTLGCIDTTPIGTEQQHEAKLIENIQNEHHKRLTDRNMNIQLVAVLEGKRKVDDLITQVRNLHYVKHPKYLNLFVLTRKDQFDNIISIFQIRKRMEELKQEVDSSVSISQTDFENFISRAKEIIDRFKKVVEPVSSKLEPVKFGEFPFPFAECLRHVGQCDDALENASRQVTTLFPQSSKCTIS